MELNPATTRASRPMRTAAAMILALAGASCSPNAGRDVSRDAAPTTSDAAANTSSAAVTENWTPPAIDSTPDDPFEAAAYRGLAILTHTRDSLPRFVGANLNCTSCHLDQGRRANAAPLAGVHARYPRFIDRAAAVVPLEDRVNYCFTRSLAGSRLPNDSREMQDIVAYLAYISRGVPVGGHVPGEGMPKMPALTGDSAQGRRLFDEQCARCHGADGAGIAAAPALWGPRSFSNGASMARIERAASFIRHNMPFDKPGTLTDQQAFHVAAFIDGMARPDMPGKERDWPEGGAPGDVPYDTRGHKAAGPPALIARAGNPAAAIVDAPASVSRPR
jgi:thiosulfate dehydrogenase